MRVVSIPITDEQVEILREAFKKGPKAFLCHHSLHMEKFHDDWFLCIESHGKEGANEKK